MEKYETRNSISRALVVSGSIASVASLIILGGSLINDHLIEDEIKMIQEIRKDAPVSKRENVRGQYEGRLGFNRDVGSVAAGGFALSALTMAAGCLLYKKED